MTIEITPEFSEEKNKVSNAPIFLYTIHDYDGIGSNLRFAEWSEDITFNSLLYTAFPCTHDQIGENAQGEIDAIRVSVGNVSRLIQAYLETYDLRSKKVTITMVWEPTLADPDAKVDFIYFIDSYTADEMMANFLLLPKTDVLGVTLPGRTYSRNQCRWVFKSTECGYVGAQLTCNKTRQRCKELVNYPRFGGFPSIPARPLNG